MRGHIERSHSLLNNTLKATLSNAFEASRSNTYTS